MSDIIPPVPRPPLKDADEEYRVAMTTLGGAIYMGNFHPGPDNTPGAYVPEAAYQKALATILSDWKYQDGWSPVELKVLLGVMIRALVRNNVRLDAPADGRRLAP